MTDETSDETNIETTDTSLTIRRTFDAPRERVFRAFTAPEELAGWYLEDTDQGTRLTWSESSFGRVNDEVQAGQWLPPFKHAIVDGLKPYVEGDPVPDDASAAGA